MLFIFYKPNRTFLEYNIQNGNLQKNKLYIFILVRILLDNL